MKTNKAEAQIAALSAQIATLTTLVGGGASEPKSQAKPMPSVAVPKIKGCLTSLYKSQKGHISLQVVSTEAKVELPNGSNKPLQLFIGNIYKADGTTRTKEELKFTIDNLKKEAELTMLAAEELEKHFA